MRIPANPQLRDARPRAPYYWLAIVLLVTFALLNANKQANFFEGEVLGQNLRTYLPAMLVAAAQTVVVLGGGIDLSLGAMVSLLDVIMVSMLDENSSSSTVIAVACLMPLLGMACGALNGFCAAYLRLQPIVTTFATSFLFAGLAQVVMSTPSGQIPLSAVDAYQKDPLGIPLAIWVAAVVLGLWKLLTSTRFRDYLYGVGGDPIAAFASGVPVQRVRMSSYMVAGFLCGGAAVATVLSTGTGDPNIGIPYTLPSVVAVVIGGTLLRGGRGGIAGSLLGAVVLGFLGLLISVSIVSTYWQPFIQGIAIVTALALPGIVARVRPVVAKLAARRRVTTEVGKHA